MFIIEDIIKKAKEGDAAAVNSLIERYKYLIFKEASKYHVPGYIFEDMVQHGYLSVIRAVKKYRLGSNSFDGYFIKSIKNNFKDLVKRKVKHFREIPDNSLLDINTYNFTLEDQITAYHNIKELYEALDKLSNEERDMIERFYLIEDSLKEIACDSSMNYYSAVKMKEKILKKLKKLMEK